MNEAAPPTSKPQSATANVVKKTVSLPGVLYDQGKARAEKARRNFSNYVAMLIEADTRNPKSL